MAAVMTFLRDGLAAAALAAVLGGAALAGETAVPTHVDVPVPATMIYAGQPIPLAALTMRRVTSRYAAAAGIAVDAGQLDGKLARSTLVPGRPIALSQLREPHVINASKPVTIVYRAGALVITGEVIPLSSAAAGERVRARNVDTGLVVSGIAQADGTLLATGR
ncbi:MAG: flagella basal body P-ring formation protein FlgA [Alphaproteobacteria bacterium]|nr:MAG: flagella basal body P-ring formation protein FlgA [Alphaproteobacteria bacterium]